jgi:hypothetical protein
MKEPQHSNNLLDEASNLYNFFLKYDIKLLCFLLPRYLQHPALRHLADSLLPFPHQESGLTTLPHHFHQVFWQMLQEFHKRQSHNVRFL